MIRKFAVRNFKSLPSHDIELGRVNVFIGENGCGKTNVLEAFAMAAASLAGKVSIEELYLRGVRIARPSLTTSAFHGKRPAGHIEFEIEVNEGESLGLRVESRGDAAESEWFDSLAARPLVDFYGSELEALKHALEELEAENVSPTRARLANVRAELDQLSVQVAALPSLLSNRAKRVGEVGALLEGFAIYDASTGALRGLQNVSRRAPLGIYGENLDVALATLPEARRQDLIERARTISWLDTILLDAGDELKFSGYKLGRSTSTLYFRDRFMSRKNNVFSAENANEGVLHLLFYLVLFSHPATPKVIAVDNIETALNPQLCRELMKHIAELTATHGKQALITTHNPAVLDGLNLHDDEQRLFVVSRNDDGATVTERIRLKPDTGEARYKLSELWMRGHLGGLPERF